MSNWENSSSDGERFSQHTTNGNGNKSLESFDIYYKRKEDRAAAKKAKNKGKVANSNETSSIYTNWH